MVMLGPENWRTWTSSTALVKLMHEDTLILLFSPTFTVSVPFTDKFPLTFNEALVNTKSVREM